MAGMVTQAIVLRYVNYRENDRMLTLLTPEYGLVTAISRGCRKPKSALMACSEWFVCGSFELVDVNRRKTLTGCEIQDSFYPLRENMERLACACFMASICEQLAQQGQESGSLYRLLMKGLYYLAYDMECDAFALAAAFLLKCIDEAGYRPRLKHCVQCSKLLDLSEGAVFDFENGGLICDACTAHGPGAWVSRQQIIWMCRVLRNPFCQQKDSEARKCLRMLRAYTESRIGLSFRSMSMMDQYMPKDTDMHDEREKRPETTCLLRPAEPQEAALLAQQSKDAFDQDTAVGSDAAGGPPGYDSETWYKEMQEKRFLYTFLVNHQMVGGAVLFSERDALYVGRIFIAPAYMRKGYGLALMDQVEKLFPNAKTIRLDTPEWNRRTTSFYPKCGYHEVKREEGFIYFEKTLR